jgi:hypothetical protein
VFGPPETLADVVPAAAPPAPPPATTGYAGMQLVLAAAATLAFVLPATLPSAQRAMWAGIVLTTLCFVGGLLDGRRWATRLEPVRLALIVPLALVTTYGA